jgi:hypothetical protein
MRPRSARYLLYPDNVDPYLPSSFSVHVTGTATCEPLQDVLAFETRSSSAPCCLLFCMFVGLGNRAG